MVNVASRQVFMPKYVIEWGKFRIVGSAMNYIEINFPLLPANSFGASTSAESLISSII